MKLSLLNDLEVGETEVIVLAKKTTADLIFMDERKGRRIAKEFGLKTTGILGILLKAKQEGLIPHVAPYLERLTTVASFYLSNALYDRILKISNER